MKKYIIDYLARVYQAIIILTCPGYSVSMAFFNLEDLDWLERAAISIGISLFALPVFFVIANYQFKLLPINSLTVWSSDVTISILCYIAVTVYVRVTRSRSRIPKWPSLQTFWRQNRTTLLYLLTLFLIYCAMMTIFVGRYFDILTEDAVYFKYIADLTISTGFYPHILPEYVPIIANSYQPVFPLFAAVVEAATKINSSIIFRYGIPLFFSITIIPVYLLGRSLYKNDRFGFLAGLLLITTPIIMTELSTARAQIYLFYITPLVLYLFIKSFNRPTLKISIIWLSFIIIMLGIKTHFLFLLLVPLWIATVFIHYYKWAKSSPARAMIYLGLIALFIYPYAQLIGAFDNVRYLLSYFPWHNFSPHLHGEFKYFTYFANWGFSLPVLAVIGACQALTTKRHIFKGTIKRSAAVILLLILILLTFQELLPRLGWPFLPDRAFPHLAVALIPLAILPLSSIRRKFNRLTIVFVFILFCASGVATFYINLLDTGPIIDQNEVNAANYLDQKTPKDSIVLTQPANYTLIFSYAHRRLLYGSTDNTEKLQRLFMNADKSADLDMLKTLSNPIDSLTNNRDRALAVLTQALAGEGRNQSEAFINQQFQLIEGLQQDISWEIANGSTQTNIYVLYTNDKDQSFLNRFLWWRNKSFLGADIDKFNHDSIYQKVYSNPDATIWKVNLDSRN